MTVKLDTSGADDFLRKLEKLKATERVSLHEMVSPAFVRKHSRSKFDSFQALIDASGIEEAEQVNGEAFSQFIARETDFADWNEMRQTAESEYLRGQLGV